MRTTSTRMSGRCSQNSSVHLETPGRIQASGVAGFKVGVSASWGMGKWMEPTAIGSRMTTQDNKVSFQKLTMSSGLLMKRHMLGSRGGSDIGSCVVAGRKARASQKARAARAMVDSDLPRARAGEEKETVPRSSSPNRSTMTCVPWPKAKEKARKASPRACRILKEQERGVLPTVAIRLLQRCL